MVLIILSIFLVAVVAGSFLNYCIKRIPLDIPLFACGNYTKRERESLRVIHSRSRKLGYVKVSVNPRDYFVVFVTFISFLLLASKFAGVPSSMALAWIAPVDSYTLLPVYLIVVCSLIVMSFIDIDHFILPDRFTIGGVIFGLLSSICFPSLHDTSDRFLSLGYSLFGAIVGFGFLWSFGVIAKLIVGQDAMGFGDVKLLAAFGSFFGVEAVFLIFFFSTLVGAIMGLPLLYSKYIKKTSGVGSEIPFGPALCISAFLYLLSYPEFNDALFVLSSSLF